MKKLSKFRTGCLFSLALIFVFAFGFSTAQAQTTAFNFQGRLNDGSNPANGRYDLQFKLYDAIAGGNPVGATVSKPNLLLINGVFSTALDFGAAAFSGGDRFLEISLRQNGSTNAYVILGARQQILSVPYAAKSLNASNADNATNSQNAVNANNATNSQNAVNAQNATNATNATNAQTAVNSQQLGSLTASRYVAADTNGDVSFSGKVTFNGNVYQPATAAGLPKAFVRLNRAGVITNCYNAATGQSANNCGFTTSHPATGVYTINFGFDISSRIVLVTTELDLYSTVGTLERSSASTIGVQVHYVGGNYVGDSTDAPINVIVY